MKFYVIVGLLLVVFVAFGLAQQNICHHYGNCDPGPDCENPYQSQTNLEPSQHTCLDCSDGGYVTWDRYCDGVEDCISGMDEKDCDKNHAQSALSSVINNINKISIKININNH